MKTLQGKVKSAKQAKTVIVVVTRRWQHPLYKKFVKKTKSYAAHIADEKLKVQAGDTVVIQECRPVSKTKHFMVVEKIGNAKAEMIKEEKVEEKKEEKKEKKMKKVATAKAEA